jgi:RNA polymerase sigma-70 factor (ECF subfamily)
VYLESVEPSDETLCGRVATRDEAAFEALAERYQQRAHRLAWSILRDAEEARDVSQEAFVRLWTAAGSFRGRARFSTWFYRLLVNLCLDHRRRHRWWHQVFTREERAGGDEPSELDRQAAPACDPVDAIGRERRLADVWEAAARLSPQQRAVLALHVQEGLGMSEVAAVLGCAEATARVHLHRALTALRGTLAREER